MATVTAPVRTLDQRLLALLKAHDHRTRRARLKEDIMAKRRTASEIIADPPEWADTMRLSTLLLAVRGWGRAKVRKLFAQHGMSPSKTLGGMSLRQRQLVLEALKGR